MELNDQEWTSSLERNLKELFDRSLERKHIENLVSLIATYLFVSDYNGFLLFIYLCGFFSFMCCILWLRILYSNIDLFVDVLNV